MLLRLKACQFLTKSNNIIRDTSRSLEELQPRGLPGASEARRGRDQTLALTGGVSDDFCSEQRFLFRR